MKKIIILFLAVILLGAIGYRKFKQRRIAKEKQGNAEEIFPVETTSVGRGTIQKVISLIRTKMNTIRAIEIRVMIILIFFIFLLLLFLTLLP